VNSGPHEQLGSELDDSRIAQDPACGQAAVAGWRSWRVLRLDDVGKRAMCACTSCGAPREFNVETLQNGRPAPCDACVRGARRAIALAAANGRTPQPFPNSRRPNRRPRYFAVPNAASTRTQARVHQQVTQGHFNHDH
jgi:hypothetical protein